MPNAAENVDRRRRMREAHAVAIDAIVSAAPPLDEGSRRELEALLPAGRPAEELRAS